MFGLNRLNINLVHDIHNYHRMFNMTDATGGVGTAFPSAVHEFTLLSLLLNMSSL